MTKMKKRLSLGDKLGIMMEKTLKRISSKESCMLGREDHGLKVFLMDAFMNSPWSETNHLPYP